MKAIWHKTAFQLISILEIVLKEIMRQKNPQVFELKYSQQTKPQ